MALTYTPYPSDGVTKVFVVAFPYLKRTHIKIYVGGIETTAFTWLTDATIQLDEAVTSDSIVLIRRVTPKDDLQVDFSDSALLDEETLDISQESLFYIMQEVSEATEDAILKDVVSLQWDATGNRVTNVADPIDSQDAVTKAFMESQVSAIEDVSYIEGIRDDIEAGILPALTGVSVTNPLTIDKTDPKKPVVGLDPDQLPSGGIEWVEAVAINTDAVDGTGYPFDNTLAPHTLKLPLNPPVNTQVAFKDAPGKFDQNLMTIDRNGQKIEGREENFTTSSRGYSGKFVFIGGDWGWLLTNSTPTDSLANKPVNGVYSTGQIDGGGIASHTDTTITMNAFSTYAEDTGIPLFKEGSSVVDLGATPAAGLYHLFAVKNTDGTYGYKADTDINGVNLAGIVAKKWDSFVLVLPANTIAPVKQEGDSITFFDPLSQKVLTTGTAYVLLDFSPFLPLVRVASVDIITGSATWTYFSFNGSTQCAGCDNEHADIYEFVLTAVDLNSVYAKSSTAGGRVMFNKITLKR